MTRQQYMNAPLEKKEQAHREYYAQFVTPRIIRAVAEKLGKRILKSTDSHLNDIPLIEWDHLALNLNLTIEVGQKMRACNDFYSQAGGVCVLKEAARQIIDNQKK